MEKYTVSHFSYAPLFQGPRFRTKMLESNIIYDHLLNIDILFVWWHRKKVSESLMRIILLHQRQYAQPERLYFIFAFCVRHYPWWSLRQHFLIKQNPLFGSLDLVTPLFVLKICSFWRHINVSYDNQTCFLRKMVCHEKLVDIEVSKH